jgi:hypothetical protein
MAGWVSGGTLGVQGQPSESARSYVSATNIAYNDQANTSCVFLFEPMDVLFGGVLILPVNGMLR